MKEAEEALLTKIIKNLREEEEAKEKAKDTVPEYVKDVKGYRDKLLDRVKRLSEKEVFKPGDIVVWKEGLKNTRLPEYGHPGIVLSILPAPVKEDGNDETVDIMIGFITEENDFLAFNFDSSRFTICKI